ncbi:MAG: hypothetical protein ACOYBE_04590 [Blautia sp.]|jgi:hypothetical protein
MKRVFKIVSAMLMVVWILGMSGMMLFCFLVGPPPDMGILYILGAVVISILMPVTICVYYRYIKWLEKENERLKEAYEGIEKNCHRNVVAYIGPEGVQ